DVQMVFWGRKGLATSNGKLNTVGRFFKGGASIVNLSADHVMITKQPTDQLKAWPPCFETLAIVHQPYIPAPIKVGTHSPNLTRSIKATPNPTNHEINLGLATQSMDWKIIDATGRILFTTHTNAGNEIIINVAALSSGMYFAESITDSTIERAHYRTQFIKID
ncbi:MAG: T9SS C-terminal target domain-containing protein, partial [Bacteroidetes bacterium]|nr:T9SS C-terminal target domain-containing protein [Bacteroidota bacterium]